MKILYIILFIISPLTAFCQTVTGNVQDQEGKPLAGITVSVKDTKIATATNEKGQFRLVVEDPAAVIRFTSENMETHEIRLAGQKALTVVLKQKTNSLDEVHIIAYGTSTQRNTVGSITKVSGADISAQPVTNPLAGLEGRVPGMVVSSTSGIPGASFTLQIRGQNAVNPSLSGNIVAPLSQPLFIIDGVPYAPQNGNINQFPSLASPGSNNVYNNKYGGISPFDGINPSDIESVEVLRDADATAIYGSRGGNGVIIITTKKGQAGKTQFNLNIVDGESVVGHTMPMMNTSQYLAMRKQAFANDGLTPNNIQYDQAYAPDLTLFDTTRNTDWKKYFFGNTAHNLNVNSSLSGGTANTQFRLGAGFNRDTYIFPGDYADSRASFSANVHHISDNKRLTVDFTATYSYEKNNSSGNPNLLLAYTLEPDYPSLLDSKGNLVWNYNGVPLDGAPGGWNALSYLKELYTIQNTSLNSNLLIGYKIIDGLTFRTSLGYSTYNSQEYYGDPVAAQNPEYSPVASTRFGNNNFMTWILEPQLEYKRTFKKASFNLLIGGTIQKNTNYQTETDGSGYVNDVLIQSISGSPVQYATDSYSEYKYIAAFGRFNFKWDGKYIVDITGNRDGSSRFGPNKQFGNFGSVGGAWLFNEENFFKNKFSFITYGKLRVSYGITGSDQIANYQFLSRWNPTTYNYGGNIGYTPQNLYNPDFSWATTRKLEFGLELGFVQDRILLNSTWYRNRSGNQLVTYNLPAQTGFSSVLENENAVVQNTGFEFTLQSTILKTKALTWTSAFNITFPKNKLLSFPGLAESSYSTTYRIGQPISIVNVYRYAGVNPGTGYFQFYNASGQITEDPVQRGGGSLNDQNYAVNLDPKFYGGWQNSFSYKQFQLNIFLEYRKQTGVNYLQSVYSYLPGNEFNQPVALLNAWSKPGQVTNFEMLSSQYSQAANEANYFLQSSGIYSDASYLRLKTLSFSYSLPQPVVKKLNLQNIRFYVSAQNLFTITNYKGNDPETQNFYGVPPLKTIVCGLQLTF
ncbi:SusC/RagA family TonB-linked outer membrane protein [Mucilaginibacter gotjawali]|uniref:TonB-dependent Receptor Plug Domain protein n=2 Tax=Mucilaginibacter gotjawali TaxID=1550579 RepID=A0A110AZP7_9SPHI|nr:SusC/RagA family TonB-linked outer membrane protein [Mucilaginibacter gotjawali]MBB3054265.1 TonB-linked SusC/RagA family outer membrane protein [Mucilaginibacter gotjawali]BAU51901.1 TonB-dependent Receptor Plug Domain protein [Mucilaginibacter gotjawali]